MQLFCKAILQSSYKQMSLKREKKFDISVHTWSDSFSQKNLRPQDLAKIRNPSETLLVNLVPIRKKLSRTLKA